MAERIGARGILLCAATRWEAAALGRRSRLAASQNVTLVRTGIGPEKTKVFLAGIPDPTPWDTLISVGLAGGLQPGILRGDIVVDLSSQDEGLIDKARQAAAVRGLRLHFGRIADSESVVHAPAAKADLGRRTRCAAVDMESAALREWAVGKGVAFLAARVVLDPVSESLPRELPDPETPGSVPRLLRAHPLALPRLALLGWRSSRAMLNLGRFLEDFLPCL